MNCIPSLFSSLSLPILSFSDLPRTGRCVCVGGGGGGGGAPEKWSDGKDVLPTRVFLYILWKKYLKK